MNDLISRHGVSAWLDNMGHPKLADAILDEKRFPPADKPVGEWIEDHSGSVYCECCGSYLIEPQRTNFCPNCGADMRCDNNG